MQFESFNPGKLIMKQGDESDNKMYILLKGQVAIFKYKDRNVFLSENMKS